MTPPADTATRIWLVYDAECPACNYYCHLVQVRESVGQLVLVNAREASRPDAAKDIRTLMDTITARGLDIDQGMVLVVDEQLYYGADAIHALALLGSPSGLFNRFNYRVFRSPTRARWLYPALRACRNLLLRLLGKRRINNLELPDNSRF